MTTGSTAVLVAGLLSVAPSADAAGTRVVRGHDYNIDSDFTSSQLVYWESSCADPLVRNPNRYYALYRRGGAADTTQAIGFGPRNAKTGGEVGLLARVDDPRSLNYLNAHVDADGKGDGHLQAYLRGDGGWYVGSIGLTAQRKGWGEWVNLADGVLTWYFIDDEGTIFETEPGVPWIVGGTIAEIANANADVSYGRVGLFFGCAGEEYVIDNLRVGTAEGVTTYDLQGVGKAPAYTLAWNANKKKWGIGRKQTLEYGEAVAISGIALPRNPDRYYIDSGRLVAQTYGSKKWRPVGKWSWYDADTTSTPQKVRPYRRTSYRFVTAGTSGDPSTSKPFVVDVRAKVKARAERGKVRDGDRIPVSGTYQPRNKGVAMSLQRKVGKAWRTIDRSRTNGAGGFSLRPRASSPGKWVLRVVAASGKGNIGNRTGSFTVRVLPKPEPPPKPAPCGSACDADTPDPVYYEPPVYNPPPANDDLPDVFRSHPSGAAARDVTCGAGGEQGTCPAQRRSGGASPLATAPGSLAQVASGY